MSSMNESKKVYLVIDCVDYETSIILYATEDKKKANSKCVKKRKEYYEGCCGVSIFLKNYYYGDIYVQAVELDINKTVILEPFSN